MAILLNLVKSSRRRTATSLTSPYNKNISEKNGSIASCFHHCCNIINITIMNDKTEQLHITI